MRGCRGLDGFAVCDVGERGRKGVSFCAGRYGLGMGGMESLLTL